MSGGGGMGDRDGRAGAYLCCGIYRGGIRRSTGGKRRQEDGEREGGRCVYKGNADGALTIVHPGQGRTLSLLNPGAARSHARVYFAFVALRARSEEESARRARARRAP